MSKEYDPDAIPDLDETTASEAERLGFQLVYIICHDKSSDQTVSFHAVTPRIPAVGEMIVIEDDKAFDIKGVIYRVLTTLEGAKELVPHVYSTYAGFSISED